ncbi:MAG TPA: SDR family oxidoreductase [Myxococcota bacterium]|jgi:3-oxoacyl-[acyl-carrier protein] reductase
MDLGIRGKRAAVAGASAGLGFATARALASDGVRVAICGRDRARIEAAARAIGENALPLVADVSTTAGAAGFVGAARAALGGLDILVTNAGGPPPGNFASTPLEAYPKAIELNLMSVIAMCREAVPAMQAQRWGRVVAITSIAVATPLPHLILSNTARAGATGFLKTLAREVAKDGVTVNSVLPGVHDTERIQALRGDGRVEDMARGIPVGRLGTATELGHVVAFLCSQHAAFITGAAIPVDGGANPHLL